MPRKSSRTSGSSPEKTATPRRATRRGQKVEEPAVAEAVVDQIPPHLLRASDESSEQSDNDSDYGSPKKGKGKTVTTGRGRGRKPKEPVVVEEKATPTRPRRGRRAARDKTPETITEESEQISQESIHSQTTGDERDETSTQSEHTAEKSESEQPEVVEELQQQQQQSEVVEIIQDSPPPSSPAKEQEQEKSEVEIENPEKVSEVQDLQTKNNDQATVNEEEEENDNDDDENEVKIHDDVIIEEEPAASAVQDEEDKNMKKDDNEEEEEKNVVVIIEESSTEVEAEDEVSKEAPELPQQEEDSTPSEKRDEKIRARSSSGEIYDDSCEKMDVDSSIEVQNKKKESAVVEVKKNTPIKGPSSSSSLKEEVKVDEPKGHQRKRKWGARKADNEPVIAITTDSLKNVISEEVKPVPLSDVKLLTPEREPEEKRPRTKSTAEEKDAKKKLLMERLRKQEEEEERRNDLLAKVIERRQTSPNIVVTNGAGKDRKVALVHEDLAATTVAQAPPTPPKNQTSRVLFITNLVRPLTVASLKILLARTGKVEDLWLDQIKSKCFVRFEKEE